MKKIWLILLVCLLLIGCKEGESHNTPEDVSKPWVARPQQSWVAVTPMGISLIADVTTIHQYNALWDGISYWEEIDWDMLDAMFIAYQQYYCYELGWNCKGATPSQLTVHIKPWNVGCKDEEQPDQPKEIYDYLNGEWQCVDGWYWQRTIYIHLGDDAGVDYTLVSEDGLTSQTYNAFQFTAYSHELLHFFQSMAGLPFSDGVMGGYTLTLPEGE